MRGLAILTFLLAASGCIAHVSGDLKVDGAPFAPTECRSGVTGGFPGIELVDASGRRLRLGQDLYGGLGGAYFPANGLAPEALAGCGTVNIHSGFGVVNGVRNLDGGAALSCRTATHEVVGSVQFENCH